MCFAKYLYICTKYQKVDDNMTAETDAEERFTITEIFKKKK